MTEKFTVGEHDVLLAVDIQIDFCPGGNLAVPHGDEVVPVINHLAQQFAHVVLTQDWHPSGQPARPVLLEEFRRTVHPIRSWIACLLPISVANW